MRCPVVTAGVGGGVFLQHVLQQERHYAAKANRLFLAVGEARYFPAANDVLARFHFHVFEHGGCVANCTDHLVLLVGRLDQGNGLVVVNQIPERAVATWIENRVVFIHVHVAQLFSAGEGFLGVGILLEPTRGLGQRFLALTVGINWRLATLR